MHGEVAAKLRAQDILPQKTLRIGLLDGLLHDPVAFHELPTNVAVNGAGLDGVSSDQDSFEDLMRIALQEDSVLEGSRLAFIGIDNEVSWLFRALGHEGPLEPAGKARSAPPAQVR